MRGYVSVGVSEGGLSIRVDPSPTAVVEQDGATLTRIIPVADIDETQERIFDAAKLATNTEELLEITSAALYEIKQDNEVL